MSNEMLILLKLLLIAAIGMLLYGIARRGIDSLWKRGVLSPTAAEVTGSIVKWTLIIVVVLVGLNIVGISVTSLWASLSAILMLVAIGFVAVWSILSNISSALLLVLSSPFRIGDEIEILEPSLQDPDKPALKGRIKDISFFYTTLEPAGADRDDHTVHVPNNVFFQKAVRCRKGDNTSSLRQALFHGKASEE